MNQIGGSRIDTLVKLVLVFFISLLSFSVGTFVGKEFSDSNHRKTALEGDYNQDREVASTEDGHEGAANEEALTDEDISRISEEFVKAEKQEKGEVAHAPADAHGSEVKRDVATATTAEPAKPAAHGTTDTTATHAAAQKVAHDKNPTEKPKVVINPTPTALPTMVASSTVGKFTVQVASYAIQTEAEAHAKKLKDQGFSAFVIPATINNKPWFRVSVGVYENRKDADVYRTKLIKQSNISSAIVQKIDKM